MSETFLILRKFQRDIVINVYRSACTLLFLIVRFQHNLNFLDRFFKNIQTLNLMKILPVGAEMFHADG